MWRNKTVESFVEWLHDYNKTVPREYQPGKGAGFYGMDVYSMHASAEAVVNYLREVDPQAAKVAEARYRCFDK